MAGNLKESVPNMATFLLMTVFPQLPLVCFLAYFQPMFFPVDKIVGSLMFIFLVRLCYVPVCMVYGLCYVVYGVFKPFV